MPGCCPTGWCNPAKRLPIGLNLDFYVDRGNMFIIDLRSATQHARILETTNLKLLLIHVPPIP